MIITRIKGGIGNQLFIYAASRRLSIKNKIDLILDDVSGFAYDNDFQRHYQLEHFNINCRKATSIERLEPFPRIRRYLKRKWNKNFNLNKRNYVQEGGRNFENQFLNMQIKNKVYLEGYLQSENFFKDIDLKIREDLLIDPPNDNKNISALIKFHKNHGKQATITATRPPGRYGALKFGNENIV